MKNVTTSRVYYISHLKVDLKSSDLSSQKIVPQPVGAGIEIPLDDAEWEQWSTPWRKTLVVKLLGKNVNFKVLDANLKRKWPKKGSITLVDMADGYFLVHFTAMEDYNYALFEGPWLVADYYLIVQRWVPMFLQNAEISKRVAVWVRIPRLPLELYNARFLWRIGSSLGNMLKIDRLTSIHSQGQFTTCVEVDLEKPLVPFIVIRGHKLFLEYEGLHSICFNYGRYSHKKDNCPEKIIVIPAQGNDVEVADQGKDLDPNSNKSDENLGPSSGSDLSMTDQEKSTNPVCNDGYGSWMVVKRNQRRKNQSKPNNEKKIRSQDVRKPGVEAKKVPLDSKPVPKKDKNVNSSRI